MSFRRDREAELAWRRWVRAHEAELLAAGVPRGVWADRGTWRRFLEHGLHPPASSARDVRFRLTDLTDEQQCRQYRLLAAEPTESRAGNDVWLILHNKFGQPATDATP